MWARVTEFMLGCWLVISPFIFGHASDDTLFWATDLTMGALVMTLALLSYWPPLRHIHLVTGALAVVLVAIGRFATTSPTPPAGQNHIMVGLLLVMFALIPNAAAQPPKRWQEIEERLEAEASKN